MTDLQAVARKAVGAKLVADQIKDIEKQAKAELLERMEKLGVRTLDVAGTGDSNMAVISKTPGKVTAKVTDERALLEWVKVNRPDQLRTLVEEAYVKSLLALAAKHGAAVDESTGEVIPGIEVETGDPFLSTRPTAEAKARMKDLLAGSSLLKLAGGETDV